MRFDHEKTLSGLFGPSTSSVPNRDLFPVMLFLMMEGLAIGPEGRKQGVVEPVVAAAKTMCGAPFIPGSAD
jgi:hypothetical protein